MRLNESSESLPRSKLGRTQADSNGAAGAGSTGVPMGGRATSTALAPPVNYTTIKDQEIPVGISSTYRCVHRRGRRAVKEQDSCFEYAVNQFKPQKAASRCTSPSKFMMEIAAFCKSLLFLRVTGHRWRKPSYERLPTMF